MLYKDSEKEYVLPAFSLVWDWNKLGGNAFAGILKGKNISPMPEERVVACIGFVCSAWTV